MTLVFKVILQTRKHGRVPARVGKIKSPCLKASVARYLDFCKRSIKYKTVGAVQKEKCAAPVAFKRDVIQ